MWKDTISFRGKYSLRKVLGKHFISPANILLETRVASRDPVFSSGNDVHP